MPARAATTAPAIGTQDVAATTPVAAASEVPAPTREAVEDISPGTFAVDVIWPKPENPARDPLTRLATNLCCRTPTRLGIATEFVAQFTNCVYGSIESFRKSRVQSLEFRVFTLDSGLWTLNFVGQRLRIIMNTSNPPPARSAQLGTPEIIVSSVNQEVLVVSVVVVTGTLAAVDVAVVAAEP